MGPVPPGARIEFRTLGTIGVTGVGGAEFASILAQPKRIALLAYLAIARPRGFHSRNSLLVLFWPEHDEQHARWALNQALRHLRRALGPGVVHSRGKHEVALDPRTVWCDAPALGAACQERQWERALDLYRGELLPAFHLSGCLEFGRWLEDERAVLRGLATRAAWELTDRMEAEGEIVAATEWARRAIGLSPHDEAGARRMIELLDRAGDRAGAMHAYKEYAKWLREELQAEPAPETQALILQVRSRTDAPMVTRVSAEPTRVPQSPGEKALGGLPEMSPRTSHSRRPVRRLAVLLGASGLMFAAAVLWAFWTSSSDSSTPSSIAVLPCASTVEATEKRFLGEVITQDLIEQLAKSGLFGKVIASQSVTSYRSTTKHPREIGAELGVDALLYCDYRQSNAEERLVVQLIDPRSAALLWTDEFENDLAVAEGSTLPVLVLNGLSRALWPAGFEQRGVDTRPLPTHDLQALHLYKEGRYLLNQFTEDAVRQAIYRFNEAIARDSTFALPYVGLSRAYLLLGVAHGSLDPREAFPLVRQAALQALALDDGLAEAHALLGLYETNFGWDWKMAERRFRDAITLDPYAPHILQSLAYHMTLVGRYDEISALNARAIAMSPVDPAVWAEAGAHYVLAGRFDDALPFLHRGLELASNFHPLLLITGILYAEMGDTRRAIDYLERADSISGHQEIIRGRLGYVHALAGDSAAARAILRDLKHRAANLRSPAKTATAIAVVHIGLGERDSAFAWLEVAYQQRSGNLVRVLRTPAGWRLASDPRYGALLDRIGIEPAVLTPKVVTREAQ